MNTCNTLEYSTSLEYSATTGITFVVYSPLGSPGRLEKESDDVNLLEVQVIKDIAKSHNATPAQVEIPYSRKYLWGIKFCGFAVRLKIANIKSVNYYFYEGRLQIIIINNVKSQNLNPQNVEF